MLYFSDPKQLFGCDPWDQSINLCREAGLNTQLTVSDYLPQDLPFTDKDFDLIYCFSVFTHLSKRAAHAALDTLRRYIADTGLLVLTIRPIEYWQIHRGLDAAAIEKVQHEHREDGFAFQPHNRTPIDGDVTYGDTSISFEYVRKYFHGWEMIKFERLLGDPYQIILFLRPRT